MRKKSLWVIVLTAIVFFAVVMLGALTVSRVERVEVQAKLISTEAETEAAALRERLVETYKNERSFSVKSEKAKEIMSEFPYFRMTEFRVVFPDKIAVKIEEDDEVFAVQTENGKYCLLSLDGTVLGERDYSKNRSDGGDNILLEGVTVTEKRGEIANGAGVAELLAFSNRVSKAVGGIRSNVSKISVSVMAAGEITMTLTMKEGVKVLVNNPAEQTDEKAVKAMECYLSLSDGARLTGEIWVVTGMDGEIRVDYKL